MIDETIIRRLAYVKSLHNSIKNQLRKASDIEIARSIVSLDSCVESFLWIILDHKKPDLDKRNIRQFADLANEIKNLGIINDTNSIKELHNIRNKIQHDGILIAKSQADRFPEICDKLFQNLSKLVFEINWNDVSLVLLIKDKKTANVCQEAECLSHNENFVNASKKLIMAFEIAKLKRQLSQFGSAILSKQMEANGLESKFPKLKPILEYLDALHGEIEVMKLGLDYMQWREYRLFLGTLDPFMPLYDDNEFKKELEVTKDMWLFTDKNYSPEAWFRKKYSFVIESILFWQDSTKDLLLPLPWEEFESFQNTILENTNKDLT